MQAWAADCALVDCVDVESLLPWERDSEFWEADGLHFSRMGSERLGTRLAEQLLKWPGMLQNGRFRRFSGPKAGIFEA